MHRMQSGGWPYSKVGRDSDPRKHRLFVQLFFVQLSFVRRSYVAIVIIDRHVLSIGIHFFHSGSCGGYVTNGACARMASLGTRPSKNRKGGSGISDGVEVYTAPGMQAHFRLAFD